MLARDNAFANDWDGTTTSRRHEMRLTEDSRLADTRVAEYFLREQARLENKPIKRPAPPERQPLITISRQYGAGGHTVAEELARVLGDPWHVWDREIIDAVAKSAQVRREMIEALDEHSQSWLDQAVRNITNVPVIDPSTYRRHIAQVMLALGQQGRKIIIGRGACMILPEALNVRLCAPIDFRVDVTMRRENLSREAALRKLRRVDRERAEFTVTVFGRGVDDPRSYDMVIQSDLLGIEETVGAILGAARARYGSRLSPS
jgi:cytidylate kinase